VALHHVVSGSPRWFIGRPARSTDTAHRAFVEAYENTMFGPSRESSEHAGRCAARPRSAAFLTVPMIWRSPRANFAAGA